MRIQFKPARHNIFDNAANSNELVIKLQPKEAIYLKMNILQPGLSPDKIIQSELDLTYMERYAGVNIPEAYERLLLDAVQKGDQQHFVRRDESEAAWRVFDPLLSNIDSEDPPWVGAQCEIARRTEQKRREARRQGR